jgi:hypothetical protein
MKIVFPLFFLKPNAAICGRSGTAVFLRAFCKKSDGPRRSVTLLCYNSFASIVIPANSKRAKVSPSSKRQPSGILDLRPNSESNFFASALDMVAIFQCFCNSLAISSSEKLFSSMRRKHSFIKKAQGTTCSGWVGEPELASRDDPQFTYFDSG